MMTVLTVRHSAFSVPGPALTTEARIYWIARRTLNMDSFAVFSLRFFFQKITSQILHKLEEDK